LTLSLVDLWSELGISEKSDFDQAVVDQTLGVSSSAISHLEERQAQLLQLKACREKEIRSLAGQIAVLWNRFSVPAEEREAFFANHEGLGAEVLEAVNSCRLPTLFLPWAELTANSNTV
jgi:hypothetical protein